jgi:hypothetical protein
MPLAVDAGQPVPSRGLAWWRVLVWALLLLAALGCLQYVRHAQQVWGQLQTLTPADMHAVTALRGMLGWDAAYLLAAAALVVICAGCILRQAWARRCLRVAAPLLALWLLLSGAALAWEWHALFSAAGALAPGQGSALSQPLAQMYRSVQLALLFKAVAALLLFWLSWWLGKPAARAQFRARR